jgi:hypothetical protein
LLGLSASALEAADSQPFLEQHCFDCHDAETKKGGLDLTTLQTDFANPKVFAAWVRVHDRVSADEMPPPKRKELPDAQAVKAFTGTLQGRLHDFVSARQSTLGRVVARRLTREEYEGILHDLLGVRVPLREVLPEDPKAGGFDRIDEMDANAIVAHGVRESYGRFVKHPGFKAWQLTALDRKTGKPRWNVELPCEPIFNGLAPRRRRSLGAHTPRRQRGGDRALSAKNLYHPVAGYCSAALLGVRAFSMIPETTSPLP